MLVASPMGERIGFRRSPNLDGRQEALPVFGFRHDVRDATPERDSG